MKMKELLKDLYKHQVLGKEVAHVHVTEFQKRGLPHCQILLFVSNEDKPLTTAAYNKSICAEIPDPITNPILHEIVISSLIHGPC
jgi:hypothetical protein